MVKNNKIINRILSANQGKKIFLIRDALVIIDDKTIDDGDMEYQVVGLESGEIYMEGGIDESWNQRLEYRHDLNSKYAIDFTFYSDIKEGDRGRVAYAREDGYLWEHGEERWARYRSTANSFGNYMVMCPINKDGGQTVIDIEFPGSDVGSALLTEFINGKRETVYKIDSENDMHKAGFSWFLKDRALYLDGHYKRHWMYEKDNTKVARYAMKIAQINEDGNWVGNWTIGGFDGRNRMRWELVYGEGIARFENKDWYSWAEDISVG